MDDVSRILKAINQGDQLAASDLLPLVYGELRRLAAARMARESAGHS
ncbi:MAG: RNA polymerase subunit sigma, partial [Planctomycetaceae bacterium]|nr:RNA polymerase subunit sigma [Planctomycetaceae bacterium]